MRNSYFFILLLSGCLFAFFANAQPTVTIGAGASSGTSSNGATGDPGPIYRSSASSSFDYSRHHYLYTAAELSAAGLPSGAVITSVAWFKANTAASNGNFQFEIWLENSSLTAVQSAPQTWANMTNGGTQVYNTSSQTLSSATGFVDFTLTSPFTYTGSALEISVAHNSSMISGSPFTAGISWKKDAISNRTISYVNSVSGTTLNNNRTVRPQLRITYISCTAVSGLTASNVTNNAATLNWSAVSGSQGYEYVLNTNATPPTGAGTAISGTTFNATSLQQSTTYYMHVRNKCSSTSLSTWTTTSFTTLTSCFPTSSVNVTNLTASTGTLSWSPVATSMGYEYIINQNAGSPTGNGTATTATSVPFSGLSAGDTYYAHVRNICAANDISSWTNYQFTMKTCNQPTNVLISNVTETTADVLWSMIPDANGYEYVVDFSNQHPTATSGFSSTTSITAHLTGLIPNSKYYLHVRSKCFAVDSSGWKLDSFITLAACYSPILQVNGLGTNTPEAYWDPVPTAMAYEYALTHSSALPAFGTEIYTTNVHLTLTDPERDYYLHVRTKCNSMFTVSAWSSTKLREGATNISSVVGTNQVEIYPNPVKDKLHVNDATKYWYSITDITGRVLLQGEIKDDEWEIYTKDLRPGLHILRLKAENDERIFKFNKQ